MRNLVISFLLAILLLVPAARVRAVEADPIAPDSWTVILLPDTQHYVDDATRAAIFDEQTQWIADHKTSHNITMVLHQGDVSNNNVATQFAYAKHSMDILRTAGVPYSIAPGNHDYGPNGKTTTRDTLFNNASYFGAGSTYATQTHFTGANGGFFESGKTDNSWCTFSAGGRNWLVFSVEFGPRDEVVTWMDDVAASHTGYHFILNTHAYLYSDSTRYDWATYGTAQKSNPHGYTDLVNSGTTINDGHELWDNLVKKYPTWKFTINGHVLNDGTGWLDSYGDNGNVVHQMLANYQSRADGGEGYLRILEFMADNNTVNVSTYSPYRSKYLQLYDQRFTLKMDELSSPTTPTLRGCSAASLNVYDSNNLWIVAGSGPGTVITTSPADKADVSIAVNEIPTYRNQGVMIATVRQNSRNGYYGAVEVSHVNVLGMQGPTTLQIATSRAYYGDECNMNVAVAHSPFADGWIGSHVKESGILLDHYGVSAATSSKRPPGATKSRSTASIP